MNPDVGKYSPPETHRSMCALEVRLKRGEGRKAFMISEFDLPWGGQQENSMILRQNCGVGGSFLR